jgi:flagellar biosynthesis protein FlhB
MSDKSEDPTPRKLEQARSRGQVIFSVELNAAIGLLAAAFLLQGPGTSLADAFRTILHNSLISLPSAEANVEWLKNLVYYDVSVLVFPVASIILGMMVIGVSVTLLQIGLKISNERKLFDFGRVNPISGLKRIFSLSGIQRLVKEVLKLFIIGWVVYSYLRSNISPILMLAGMDVQSGISEWFRLTIGLI